MRAKNFIANLIECRQRVSTTPMDDLILSKHFLAGEFYWHIDACKIPAVKFITGGRLFVKYFSENQITLRLYIFFYYFNPLHNLRGRKKFQWDIPGF
jgi:hypothetical protein